MTPRINLLLIDRHMNTVEIDIPTFMLGELNLDLSDFKKHESKKELNTEVTNFINKHNQ